MKHNLRAVLVTCAALIAVISTEDADSRESEEDIHKDILKDLAMQSVVLQDQENPDSKVSALRYITCDGNTWSCEDCNTRKFCVQFWWYTGVTYFQCPIWAPYCVSSSSLAWCSNTAPSTGCSGETTTAAATTAAATTAAATTDAATTAAATTDAATTAAATTDAATTAAATTAAATTAAATTAAATTATATTATDTTAAATTAAATTDASTTAAATTSATTDPAG